MGQRIIRNAAKCLECGVTVESEHRHDFKSCDCGAIFVDGGKDYLRRGAKEFAKVEDLSIVEEDGPSIDGGNDEFTTALLGGVEK